MNNSNFLSSSITQRETQYGWVWLVFETLIFSWLLQVLNQLLPTPLPQAEVNFLFFSVNFTVVVILFRRYLWAQIRQIPDLIGNIIFTVIAGFIAYLISNFLLMQVLLTLNPKHFSVNDVTIQSLVEEDYFLMFLGSVILVPITEECLFRGLVFRGVYDRSPILAWVLSIVLFSSVHIISYLGTYPAETILLCFVQYIPAGVCLAGAYRLSGSLLSPILIHALVNLLGMMALR